MRRHNNRRNGKVWIAQGENVEPSEQKSDGEKSTEGFVMIHTVSVGEDLLSKEEKDLLERESMLKQRTGVLFCMLQKRSAAASKDL